MQHLLAATRHISYFSSVGFISFLQHHLLPCPFKALLHIDCPGCGMQRSFICLLQGDLHSSLQYHPATIPMLVLVIFAGLHLYFKFRRGAAIIVGLQGLVAVLMLSFYVYKMLYGHLANI